MTTWLNRLCPILVLHALAGAPALAEDEGMCGGVGGASPADRIGVARVTSAQARLHFVLAPEAGLTECPAPLAKCRGSAYLVPGDVVLTLTGPHKGHLCASYVDRSGRETYGWLPAGRLAAIATAPVDEAGWIGTWRRTEAVIRIARGRAAGLRVDGEATWGGGDKARVAKGAVNTGELAGPLRRSGDAALVADADIASFEAAPKDRCTVRMRRLGPYLLVEDNGACGGMNVTFSGLYVRR